MMRCTATILLILISALSGHGQSGQQAAAGGDSNRVIGEISAVDIPAGRLTIRRDSGNLAAIFVDYSMTLFRVPPGEQSLEKAQRIKIVDLNPGDRLFARYNAGANSRVAPARQVVVISVADIKKRETLEKEAWQKRGNLCFAQHQRGTRRGQLTDELGGVLAHTQVMLVDAGGTEIKNSTDERGVFSFEGIPAARYTLKVTVQGFAPFEKRDIVVWARARTSIEIKLTATVEKQQVTVSNNSACIEGNNHE